MIKVMTGFFNNGIVTILLLLIIFASVALIASWIRKILLPESKDNQQVDAKKAVKEELDRVLVPLEKPLTPKDSPSKTAKRKDAPTPTTVKKPASKNANKRRSKVS
jgi:biopolymer transport protein ExbD